MTDFNVDDIVVGTVTGIQKYGIFVSLDNDFSGLIHISEVSDGFVSNLNDYVEEGEKIKVKIIEKSNSSHHLKLSIKGIDYRISKHKNRKIKETEKGFNTLHEKLPLWIDKKLNEISEKGVING